MSRVFIIAEAGVNHNGDLKIAEKMIDKAAEAGADAVKFQTFTAQNLVCLNAKKADYQLETTNQSETQYEMLKKLELTRDMHKRLIEYCNQKKIIFLSTPFDLESINMLVELGLSIIKIPSGEITNYPYLKRVGSTGLRVILSTGMSSLDEVKEAVKVLKENGSTDITVLHCNTEYPTPMEDVNLNAMVTLKRELGLETGYSDHTKGIEIPIAAVALGATIIEKHFTLDKTMKGPDHKASIETEELAEMVKAIRNIELALGNGVKAPSESEKKNIEIVRKSIVAAKRIKKGEIFSEDNITVKRPGTGISPMKWNDIIGKVAKRDFEMDDFIEL